MRQERGKRAIYGKGVHKCCKCGGRAPFNKEENVYKCMTCGHEEKELSALYQFCEEHKREIIQNFLDIGPRKTRAKWGIPLEGWYTLRRKWHVHLVWTCPGFCPHEDDGHRKLPAFNHAWSDELKLAWFSAYQASLGVIKGTRY